MTPGKPIQILVHEWVTGGGLAGQALPETLAREGGAMRRAIVADFASLGPDSVRVVMTLDERLAGESINPEVDVVPIRAGEGEDRVIALAREVDYTLLVAPETGGTLARLTRAIEQAGGRTLGSSAEAVELAADKIRCEERLRQTCVRTPSSWLLGLNPARREEGVGYPAVVKPRDGAGAVDTFLVADAASWTDEMLGVRGAIVQPYVAGVPMSASFLVDGCGRPHLLAIGEQSVSIQDGKFVYCGGRLPIRVPRVPRPVRGAAGSIVGLRGFVGVDFIADESFDRITVLDVNPRPTTSYVALRMLFPPGTLSRAWLTACGVGDEEAVNKLRYLKHSVRDTEPIQFGANGAVEGVTA
jgi:predicted ATP-grasp superfamily ATP-dependent carboligase